MVRVVKLYSKIGKRYSVLSVNSRTGIRGTTYMIKHIFGSNLLHKSAVIVLTIVCVFTALNPFEVLSPSSIPPGDDSRAHVYRISGFVEEYVTNKGLSFKQYNSMLLLSYAPLFYAILYPISLLFGPALAYKIGRIFACALYTMSVYLLACMIGVNRKVALLIIPIATYFPTLWFVYYKGAYPYLLSWSLTLISVSLLLMYIKQLHSHEMLVLSALVGGLSILVHSYGLINMVLPLAVFMFYNRHTRGLKNVIEFCVYLLIALSISLFYIYSVVLTIRDASPLNETSPCIWLYDLPVDPINLLIAVVSLYMALHVLRIRDELNEERKIVFHGLAIFTSLSLVSTVFVAIKIPHIYLLNKAASLVLPWRFLYINNATFITLGLASSRYITSLSGKRTSAALFIVMLVTVAIVTSVVVTSTVAPYERPIDEALPNFIDIVRGSRVLVLGTPLTLSNSPVAFSILGNYTTATGSYNQGDPAFFDLTVYYEWMNTLVKNAVVLENIVELTRSRYVFTDLDLGVKSIPLVSINLDECTQEAAVLQNVSWYKLLCLFREQLELGKFSSIMVRLRNSGNTDTVVRVQMISNGGVEEEMMLLDDVEYNGSRTIVFQLPYSKLYRNTTLEGLEIHLYLRDTRLRDTLTDIEITVGTVNLVKVDSYGYRGHRLTLYEYYRDPPTAISSRVILFDTDTSIPKALTILASEGYNSILIADRSNRCGALVDFVAGVVTDNIERAESYIKMGCRTVLITYGERFYIKNQTKTFAHIETPLLNPKILPHDPGNPVPYLNWDRETKAGDLWRYVDEATRLWHFLKKFMNISVNIPRTTIKYTPPEIDTESIEGQATLVKIAYISIWNSNTKLLRSATGFVVALPPTASPEIKLKWSPPLIDTVLNYSITALLVSLYYILIIRVYRFFRETIHKHKNIVYVA